MKDQANHIECYIKQYFIIKNYIIMFDKLFAKKKDFADKMWLVILILRNKNWLKEKRGQAIFRAETLAHIIKAKTNFTKIPDDLTEGDLYELLYNLCMETLKPSLIDKYGQDIVNSFEYTVYFDWDTEENPDKEMIKAKI